MKLNILHLNAPTGFAGAERVLLNYLSCHDKDKFTVHVASYINCQRQNNSFTEEMDKHGIAVNKILIGGQHSSTSVIRATINLINKLGIDLVHTHGYRSDVSGYLATRFTKTPIVSTVHGWTPISWKLRRYEQIDRWFLKSFDGVISVSSKLSKSLTSSGVAPNKIRLIHNAIPPVSDITVKSGSCPTPQSDVLISNDKTILAVGRLSLEKGYDVLLKSFHKYFATKPGVRLVIAGDGPLRSNLCTLAHELGIEDRVTFTGHITDVSHFYRASDVFVLPSRTEGMPMVILEAMQSGLPVVCTNVGGIPEIITDGVNGITVKPDDIDGLGSAIDMVLTNPDICEMLKSNAIKTVSEKFSGDVWARTIEKFYQEITGKRTYIHDKTTAGGLV